MIDAGNQAGKSDFMPVKQLVQLLSDGQRSGLWEQVDISDLQALCELVIHMYGRRVEHLLTTEQNAQPFMPLPKHTTVPDTEAMMFINGLMEGKHIELFELQMFKNF
ncbi:hypothetical protein [Brevibacillus sp. NRS-1366]|uniref:hypothetical protein n=1 Tax=Brevibacillus sp. NRS-1366 TaxID=3233899 RepID=UPI003D1DAD18